MTDWITITPPATGQVMRGSLFQQILTDMRLLKHPVLAETPGPGVAAAWTFSSTVTWADIDTDYYQSTFTTLGNPILAVALVRYSHSAASGTGRFRFMLDGVGQGNSGGQFGMRDEVNIQETYCLADIIENVAAGSHTLKLQVLNVTTGNTEVWKSYTCLGLSVLEL